jgi:DNA-3-methyladenine glycosylase
VDLTLGALTVAPALLGALVRVHGVTLLLTEVEAYAGADDPAAHAFRGWRPHTRHLFEPPGTLYCYRSYGIHICANVVCGPSGSGSAVLLRAGRVVDGLELARSRRPGVPDSRLARGPGCLGEALALTLDDSGRRFGDPGLQLEPPSAPARDVATGPRVGVSVAAHRPWRFWLPGEPSVSAYRPSPRMRPNADGAAPHTESAAVDVGADAPDQRGRDS